MELVFFGSAILCFSKFHIMLIMVLAYLIVMRNTKTGWIRGLWTVCLIVAVVFGYN